MGDSRYSGSEIVVRKLAERGPRCASSTRTWNTGNELESQDTYPPRHVVGKVLPQPGGLAELRVEKDLAAALKGVEALVLAVPHEAYQNLDPAKSSAGRASRWP